MKTHELVTVRKLFSNGASERNRTAVPALARPCINHYTTPASVCKNYHEFFFLLHQDKSLHRAISDTPVILINILIQDYLTCQIIFQKSYKQTKHLYTLVLNQHPNEQNYNYIETIDKQHLKLMKEQIQ